LKHWPILIGTVALVACGNANSELDPGGSPSTAAGGETGTDAAAGTSSGSGGNAGESAGGSAGGGNAGGEEATGENSVGFVDSGWGESLCPGPDGSAGTKVGDVLASVVLKTCEGEDFSLDQLCGADATWIFVAHGWCPHCRAASELAESLHDEFQAKGKNIATVNILYEDTQQRRPEGDDCAAWRDARGHADVITLYDPDRTMLQFWEEQYTALNLFVSGDRVITGKQHSDVEFTLRAGIDEALAD